MNNSIHIGHRGDVFSDLHLSALPIAGDTRTADLGKIHEKSSWLFLYFAIIIVVSMISKIKIPQSYPHSPTRACVERSDEVSACPLMPSNTPDPSPSLISARGVTMQFPVAKRYRELLLHPLR